MNASTHGINILLLIPVIIIGAALLLGSLWDLSRPERQVVGGNKWWWLLVILIGGTLGQIGYFLFGRKED